VAAVVEPVAGVEGRELDVLEALLRPGGALARVPSAHQISHRPSERPRQEVNWRARRRQLRKLSELRQDLII